MTSPWHSRLTYPFSDLLSTVASTSHILLLVLGAGLLGEVVNSLHDFLFIGLEVGAKENKGVSNCGWAVGCCLAQL